jgi:hypothetical protein
LRLNQKTSIDRQVGAIRGFFFRREERIASGVPCAIIASGQYPMFATEKRGVTGGRGRNLSGVIEHLTPQRPWA